MTLAIEAEGLVKRFGAFTALDGVGLSVKPGEFLALLGPSGSGKTTLLRIFAGLDFADAGRVSFGGQDVADRPARERQVGFVFQHYALFRHMTVFDNIAFGLRVKPRRERPGRAEIARRVNELLELVQLGALGDRFPSQLSGGQRQRVALARALAIEPKLLLLDEPFGALDAQVRKDLRRWLRQLHERMGLTSLFVTHDQSEALELADRVAVMRQGRIEQIGTPAEIWERPATPFIFRFLGDVNVLPARHENGGIAVPGLVIDRLEGEWPRTGDARAYVRTHDIEVRALANGAAHGSARIRFLSSLGPTVRIEVETADGEALVEVELPRERIDLDALKVGTSVSLHARTGRLFAGDPA